MSRISESEDDGEPWNITSGRAEGAPDGRAVR
jgi:hypothetical protein